jgi:hypothetical protein
VVEGSRDCFWRNNHGGKRERYDNQSEHEIRFENEKHQRKNHAERISAFASGTCKAYKQTRSAHPHHPILPSWSTGHKTITTKRLTRDSPSPRDFHRICVILRMPSVQTHQISLLCVSASEEMLIKNFASYVSILFYLSSCRQVPQTNRDSGTKAPLRAIVAAAV